MLLAVIMVAAQAAAAVNSVPNRARPGLGTSDLAVIVNVADPLSVAIGAYYAQVRHLPKAGIVRVRFDAHRDELPAEEFIALQRTVDARVGPGVQAYMLTWARPYRVGCMSVTAAFTFGLDKSYCASGCRATRASPYFNSSTARPYDDLRIRPSMSLAAADFEHAKELIDRGAQADGRAPGGSAYLVTTNDVQRNVRVAQYPLAVRIAEHEFQFRVAAGGAPTNPADVMFYFTGAASVPQLGILRFLPGAVADHLTSFGGMLTDSPQMSSLRWLEAGATGSYGTVVEPCNFPGKFPNIPVLLTHYLAGETLIESYWKSVLMPGQGLFIGEPLAAPFRPRIN